ncbi:MAG: hypothetical protein ABH886_07990 [Candidatus Desantisbacteria bacterium]
MIYCQSCGAHFSERKGTVLSYARLPSEKIFSLLNHIQEGCGTRTTSRLIGVSKDTVTRYIRLEGKHSKGLHDDLVAFSPQTKEVQLDEKWEFVKKKDITICSIV